MWLDFRASSEFAGRSSAVGAALKYGPAGPALLSLRVVGSPLRHVVHVFKRIITVGSKSDCDVVIKQAGLERMRTAVLRLEPEADGRGVMVTLLWSCAARPSAGSMSASRKASVASMARSSVSSSMASKERSRAAVIAKHTPRLVRYGEAFATADFEGMIVCPSP